MTLTSTDFATPRRTGKFWQRAAEMFNAYVHARARTDQIERYQAMSDAELASHGLTRDRIVLHVFRDTAWV